MLRLNCGFAPAYSLVVVSQREVRHCKRPKSYPHEPDEQYRPTLRRECVKQKDRPKAVSLQR
jgi:hypothetical protein